MVKIKIVEMAETLLTQTGRRQTSEGQLLGTPHGRRFSIWYPRRAYTESRSSWCREWLGYWRTPQPWCMVLIANEQECILVTITKKVDLHYVNNLEFSVFTVLTWIHGSRSCFERVDAFTAASLHVQVATEPPRAGVSQPQYGSTMSLSVQSNILQIDTIKILCKPMQMSGAAQVTLTKQQNNQESCFKVTCTYYEYQKKRCTILTWELNITCRKD